MDIMPKPENVHIAGPDDIQRIFFPLLSSYETNDLGLPVNPAEVAKTVTAMCTGHGGIAGIIDGNSGVAASIAIRAVKPWFTDRTMLTEVWLFVTPAYRKHNRFFDDLCAFAEWHRQDMGQRLGYDMVFENAVMHREHLPAMQRLYQRHYGPPIGAVFWAGGGQEDVSEQDQFEQPGPERLPERDAERDVGESGVGPERPGRLQRPSGPRPERNQPAATALPGQSGGWSDTDPESGD